MAAAAASYQRHWLDNVYLVYFIIHIPVLFCVDFVPFYPTAWYAPTGPLAPLGALRAFYRDTYKDQFFSATAAPPRFFVLFAWLELLHLPASVWAIGVLWPRRRLPPLSGAALVALLVYGLETALTTLTCMWEAAGWDDALVAPAEKRVLIGGLYGGYFAVAAVMTVDMAFRLCKRVEAADAVVARKKGL